MTWEFPIPNDETSRNNFQSDTTATLYRKIAEWEAPIELDLDLTSKGLE